jgi:hypothetical protein
VIVAAAVAGVVAAARQYLEWHNVLLPGKSEQLCLLCESPELEMRDELRGQYHCAACGFDTSMRERPELKGLFEALSLADNAHDNFCDGLETLRSDMGSSFFDSEYDYGENPLQAVSDLQMRGLGWLRELVDSCDEASQVFTADGRSLVSLIESYLDELAEDVGKRKSFFTIDTSNSVLLRELRSALEFVGTVQAAIVDEIRARIQSRAA